MSHRAPASWRACVHGPDDGELHILVVVFSTWRQMADRLPREGRNVCMDLTPHCFFIINIFFSWCLIYPNKKEWYFEYFERQTPIHQNNTHSQTKKKSRKKTWCVCEPLESAIHHHQGGGFESSVVPSALNTSLSSTQHRKNARLLRGAENKNKRPAV